MSRLDRLSRVARLTAAMERLASRAAVGERGRRELRGLLGDVRHTVLASPEPPDPLAAVACAVERARERGVAGPANCGVVGRCKSGGVGKSGR